MKKTILFKNEECRLTLVGDGNKKRLRFWQEGSGERRIVAFAADEKVRRHFGFGLKELIRRKKR